MYALGMAGFCVLDLINKAYYTMHKTLTPLLILMVNFSLLIRTQRMSWPITGKMNIHVYWSPLISEKNLSNFR